VQNTVTRYAANCCKELTIADFSQECLSSGSI